MIGDILALYPASVAHPLPVLGPIRPVEVIQAEIRVRASATGQGPTAYCGTPDGQRLFEELHEARLCEARGFAVQITGEQ